MEKREFKVGDKVKLPKTKSKGWSHSESMIIPKAKRENQDYLFIIRIDVYSRIKSDMYVLENNLKNINKHYKHIPLKKFGGNNECFKKLSNAELHNN